MNPTTGVINSLGADILNLWYGDFIYNASPSLSFTGEYSVNKANYATNYNTNYTIYTIIGDQTFSKAGQSNVELQYYSVGKYALGLDDATPGAKGTFPGSNGLTTYDTTFTNSIQRGYAESYTYAFSKNMNLQLYCAQLRDDTSALDNYNYYRAIVQYKF